jgi:outer membrane protein
MKKLFLFFACSMFFATAGFTQRYAIIDSKFILDKMPEYKEAQTKLDQFSELWQQEIDQKQVAMDKMVKDFEQS